VSVGKGTIVDGYGLENDAHRRPLAQASESFVWKQAYKKWLTLALTCSPGSLLKHYRPRNWSA